jgi:hypothetical protein
MANKATQSTLRRAARAAMRDWVWTTRVWVEDGTEDDDSTRRQATASLRSAAERFATAVVARPGSARTVLRSSV